METVILGIIVYVGWAIIKNFVKEGIAPGSSARQAKPPIEQGLPKADVYRDQKLDVRDGWNKPTHISDFEKIADKKPVARVEKEKIREYEQTQQELYNQYGFMLSDKQSLVNGVIMKEILGPPKSKQR